MVAIRTRPAQRRRHDECRSRRRSAWPSEYYWRVSATDGNYTSTLSERAGFPDARAGGSTAAAAAAHGPGAGTGTLADSRAAPRRLRRRLRRRRRRPVAGRSAEPLHFAQRGAGDRPRRSTTASATISDSRRRREGRDAFFWSAMAAVHYGHPTWNPRRRRPRLVREGRGRRAAAVRRRDDTLREPRGVGHHRRRWRKRLQLPPGLHRRPARGTECVSAAAQLAAAVRRVHALHP